ncbi:MAG TPA: LysR family transcriptional regulator [Blastocatellia bacterium]|nr:LysR family transcriptional regulator [Blastocatellia bacterium]
MELRLLRTFKAVAEAGSFTQAASHVHLTQSAVSVHIRQLEDELGTPLFLRVNKKLFLTDAGRALLSHAEVILRAHDEARAELTALSQPASGRLNIGVASTAITVQPLPEMLSEVKRRHPALDISVLGGTSEWIVEQIINGALDVGLVSLPVENSDLLTETLRSDFLVAALKPDHPLARSKQITAEQLTAEPLILGEKGGNTRRLIDLFFEKSNLEPKVAMELKRTEAIIKMVERGFGVTILPQSSIAPAVERGSLRGVRVRELNLRWEMGVAYLKSEYLAPSLVTFLELSRRFVGSSEY